MDLLILSLCVPSRVRVESVVQVAMMVIDGGGVIQVEGGRGAGVAMILCSPVVIVTLFLWRILCILVD